ncbi:hypothetical protein [Photobacterium kishitanii]|uniref:Uncharacterized protein n=1 Tax=Photobacterium kishitanii TaxID=318456 RepID=A0A2T3KMR9_9GAMM|nr:hypothetical protein [Photobacterium kishitanii]PSV01089.1 hypothetical protein C9J27_03460 [Photobacterium kishitanii]
MNDFNKVELLSLMPVFDLGDIRKMVACAAFGDDYAEMGESMVHAIVYFGRLDCEFFKLIKDSSANLAQCIEKPLPLNRVFSEVMACFMDCVFSDDLKTQQKLLIACLHLLRFDFYCVFSDICKGIKVTGKVTKNIIRNSLRNNHYDY